MSRHVITTITDRVHVDYFHFAVIVYRQGITFAKSSIIILADIRSVFVSVIGDYFVYTLRQDISAVVVSIAYLFVVVNISLANKPTEFVENVLILLFTCL